MQSNLIEPQQLPELPPPGFIEHWVFETPIPLALALLTVGVMLFVLLRRSNKHHKFALPALALGTLLGAATFLLGAQITTARETLKARSIQLVKAASSGDASTLDALLDEEIRVRTAFGSPIGKKNVINLVISGSQGSIESARASKVNAGLLGAQVAQTQIRVRVQGDLFPSLSWWRIDWTRPTLESNEWVVTHIEPLWIQGFSNPTGSN
jgi:hypothetical protein